MAPNMLVDTAWAIAAFGLAALTLRFGENPIRYGTVWRRPMNAAVVRFGATAMPLVGAAAVTLLLSDIHGPEIDARSIGAADRPGSARRPVQTLHIRAQ
jgi:hypothetical protein